MAEVHLVVPDPHAHPDYSNERFDWLSRLIVDIKPDVVINIGDGADMPSLCSYDKGTKSFEGRTYGRDIASAVEADDRMWHQVKKQKRKLPRRVRLIGNHEQRISRVLNLQPELAGAISMNDLQLEKYYDEVVPYEGSTPGCIVIGGIVYAHYLPAGVMGRPISGEHAAYSLITKLGQSCTVGHLHTRDFCQRTNAVGLPRLGLVAGVFQDWEAPFAGLANKFWWRGVVVKREVENGTYDHQWISISSLRKEYS